jgi:hypothetical protein
MFWIEWECPTENFNYSEIVSASELQDRLSDPTIVVKVVNEMPTEPLE